MTKEKKGLGKGLNAFFSDDNLLDNVIKKDDKKNKELETVVELKIVDVEPSRAFLYKIQHILYIW